MGPHQVARALARISHEILERNGGADHVVLVGLHTRGVHLAARIAKNISNFEGKNPPVGTLEVGLYRDDLSKGVRPLMQASDIPVSVEGKRVVLVDDVLYTGRTIRAAMNALSDFGRPTRIQLAVLIDRGHRELPIRPDYVGKNVPTSSLEEVEVNVSEADGSDHVFLARPTKS